MNENPDPLEALLRSNLPSPASPVWKDSLLTRTTHTLRRRRRGRQFGIVAALAACYAAGLFSMRLVQAKPAVEVRTEIVYLPAESKPENPPQREVPSALEQPFTALALEWQAAENPERSAELNRQAGDRYFADENDIESAVRCYKRFVATCADKELEIEPNDNWLLVTLKSARLEERRHAKING
jgi:hypothetical protein